MNTTIPAINIGEIDAESLIEHLFTDAYTDEEKRWGISWLECNKPDLLDALIQKHQPQYWIGDSIAKITLSGELGWCPKFNFYTK